MTLASRAAAFVMRNIAIIEAQARSGEVIFAWLDRPELDRRILLLAPELAIEAGRTLGLTDEEIERVTDSQPGARWILALEGDQTVAFRLRRRARVSTDVLEDADAQVIA
jgi:hypothetical protein